MSGPERAGIRSPAPSGGSFCGIVRAEREFGNESLPRAPERSPPHSLSFGAERGGGDDSGDNGGRNR
eukprot:4141693-Alexandrium_andersonii.AAC.1